MVLFIKLQAGRYQIFDFKDAGEGYQYLTVNFPPRIQALINLPAEAYNQRATDLSNETRSAAEAYFRIMGHSREATMKLHLYHFIRPFQGFSHDLNLWHKPAMEIQIYRANPECRYSHNAWQVRWPRVGFPSGKDSISFLERQRF